MYVYTPIFMIDTQSGSLPVSPVSDQADKAVGLWYKLPLFLFDSAARLSKRSGSVWNCLWGHALKRSPGINRKSMVLYPRPGFLSSATWPLLPKKHYNVLIN